MNILGRLIGAEWAKDNAVRVINTRDLKEWGAIMRRAMRRSAEDGADPVLGTFAQIEREVHRRLSPLTIRDGKVSGP
jgi:hypothetical protein